MWKVNCRSSWISIHSFYPWNWRGKILVRDLRCFSNLRSVPLSYRMSSSTVSVDWVGCQRIPRGVWLCRTPAAPRPLQPASCRIPGRWFRNPDVCCKIPLEQKRKKKEKWKRKRKNLSLQRFYRTGVNDLPRAPKYPTNWLHLIYYTRIGLESDESSNRLDHSAQFTRDIQ